MPESMMMGRWARRWKRTVTSEVPTVTVAGMLIRSRKMCPARASAYQNELIERLGIGEDVNERASRDFLEAVQAFFN
jgi:hypothetical protein